VKSGEMTYSDQRLVKIIRFSQVTMVLGAINLSAKAVYQSVYAVLPVVIFLLGAVVFVEMTIKLIHSGKKALGFRAFLSVLFSLLVAFMWLLGGLYSVSIMLVPIALMLSALYGRLIDTVCLCVLLEALILFIGLNSNFAWLPSPIEYMSEGYHRVIAVSIVTCLAGYITWAIGYDMRQAFSRLSVESKRIDESKAVISRLSKTDFLTGLINTEQAKNHYETMLSTLPECHSVYFYFMDLDGFKAINDLFDHKAGDDLLIKVSEVLTAISPEEAEVCRLSGDEFAIFFVASDEVEPASFAKTLLKKVAEPQDLYGTSMQITASIGIATTQTDGFDVIRKKADMAMFKSKRTSKNNFHLYDVLLEKEYMKKAYVVQGLEDSLHRGLLELHYQPKVNLLTQEVMGAEALIRWPTNNPQQYTPDQFMEVIESTDLVHEVGDWVIKEACIACKAWHQNGHEISMAVNVSARQLLNPEFAAKVQVFLSEAELPANYLEIELTERYLVDSGSDVEAQLAALRNIGVKLAIDDFGTGYSNISYLTDLDVDVIKLDQSFVQQLQTKPSVKHIVKGIIKVAHVMGMDVVAEGVETREEMQQVADLGCEIGQGYHWSKPVSFKDMAMYLADQRQPLISNPTG